MSLLQKLLGRLVPKGVLTYQGIRLAAGVDYTVSYSNNAGPGEATVLVRGMGRFWMDDLFPLGFGIAAWRSELFS